MYAISTLSLIYINSVKSPQTLQQVCYSDDSSAVGSPQDIKNWWNIYSQKDQILDNSQNKYI